MKTIIQKKTLADEVAGKLQQHISSGYYKPNDKLPTEPELMKNFGVGRSTIREAIKILANSGLLRVQQGIGTFVERSSVSKEPMDLRLKRADSKDLDEIRQLLEMKIAEKAAVNRTQADIISIKNQLEKRRQAANSGLLEDCIEADINFHVAIAEAAKNEMLTDLYKSVSIHLKNWFVSVYVNTYVFQQTQLLHDQLLKSIIAADPKKAWNAAAKIIGHVSQ